MLASSNSANPKINHHYLQILRKKARFWESTSEPLAAGTFKGVLELLPQVDTKRLRKRIGDQLKLSQKDSLRFKQTVRKRYEYLDAMLIPSHMHLVLLL